MKLNLLTDVLRDGRIFQTLKVVEKDPPEEISTVVGRWVSHTREKAIKEALVSLGWTPPGEQDSEKLVLAIELIKRWTAADIPITRTLYRMADRIAKEYLDEFK